jgi:hypothetical protein
MSRLCSCPHKYEVAETRTSGPLQITDDAEVAHRIALRTERAMARKRSKAAEVREINRCIAERRSMS